MTIYLHEKEILDLTASNYKRIMGKKGLSNATLWDFFADCFSNVSALFGLYKCWIKALVTAYRTGLPMDPIIRMVEGAFHKVRDSVVDETAAKFTKKPLSLASALLKISDAFSGSDVASFSAYSILGGSSAPLNRHSPVKDRIERLIQLGKIIKSEGLR